MILFCENGRVGNQLFQLNALKALFPSHTILCFGCSAFRDLFQTERLVFLDWPHLTKIANIVLRALTISYLVGCIYERRSINGCLRINKHIGFIPNLFFARDCFFQSPSVIPLMSNNPQVKSEHILAASKWLLDNDLSPCSPSLVFLHIRRGDYINYPDQASPAVLDLTWYLKAIECIKTKVPSPSFVVVTDDYYYALDFFKNLPNFFISNNSFYQDFALMTLCSHGIMSPSSYSWWGAFYALLGHNESPHIYLAPKYWIGHRKSALYPPGFEFDWITYIESEY